MHTVSRLGLSNLAFAEKALVPIDIVKQQQKNIRNDSRLPMFEAVKLQKNIRLGYIRNNSTLPMFKAVKLKKNIILGYMRNNSTLLMFEAVKFQKNIRLGYIKNDSICRCSEQ